MLRFMARDEKLELLHRIPIFVSCNPKQLERLGALTDEVHVPDGKVLMRQGETADSLMIVVSGMVRIERDGKTVARLARGEFFGEMGLLDEAARNASAIASGPTSVLVVGHREFHTVMSEFPGFAAEVMRALAGRIRNLEPNAPN
jgi:CRP-like cAMP-binding protein